MRTYTDFTLHKGFSPKYYLLSIPVLAFLLLVPRFLSADTETLERITEAERTVSYVGVRLNTFISSRGTRTFEELVIHKSPDMTYGKVISVLGERRSFGGSRSSRPRPEDRRDDRRRNRNESMRSRDRDSDRWRAVRSLISIKDIQLIAENYHLEETTLTEKIANYETDLLTITPKFTGRPTQRLFFARENGAILRVETLDAEGVLRAISVYTRISFDPEAVARKWQSHEKEIKPPPERSYSISLAEGKKILKAEPIQPEYLPPGFQLQHIYGTKEKENTIHLIYTDGLLGFSIFETTDRRARRSNTRGNGMKKMIEGTSVHEHKRGATHAFSWSNGDIHFFLFGAMPASEMEKVVKSIISKGMDK